MLNVASTVAASNTITLTTTTTTGNMIPELYNLVCFFEPLICYLDLQTEIEVFNNSSRLLSLGLMKK